MNVYCDVLYFCITCYNQRQEYESMNDYSHRRRIRNLESLSVYLYAHITAYRDFKIILPHQRVVYKFCERNSKMKTKSLPPYAPTLIESTRAIGYTLESAIADIVDNSVSASASSIDIFFFPVGDSYIAILTDMEWMQMGLKPQCAMAVKTLMSNEHLMI